MKALRYLFSRFYFWCIVPGVQDQMEGCPIDESLNMLYLVLSALIGVVLFVVVMGIVTIFRNAKKAEKIERLAALQDDKDFIALQVEMYGEKQLRRLLREDSRSTSFSTVQRIDSKNLAGDPFLPFHVGTAGKDLYPKEALYSGEDEDVITFEYDC